MLRKLFTITRRNGSYDVHCSLCGKVSKAWDYRRNALAVGWCHVVNEFYRDWLKNASWVEEK